MRKNPLEDKKWQKTFQTAFKKDIKESKKHKSSSSQIISEIICTGKDIGKSTYSLPKKGKK